MKENLFPRVLEILLARFDSPSMPPAESITAETSLADDIGMESLDIVDLIVSCETAFNVKLDMADAKNVRTIGDLIAFIETQLPCDQPSSQE